MAGLDDLAVVREPVERRGGHLGVGDQAEPLAERDVACDDQRGAFVVPVDRVEQQLIGLSERQIAELIQHDEVQPGQVVGIAAGAGLRLKSIDQIDRVESGPRAPPRMQDKAMAGLFARWTSSTEALSNPATGIVCDREHKHVPCGGKDERPKW